MSKIRLGYTQKKILLLLMGGLAMGLSGNPTAYFKIIKAIGEDWQKINKEALKESIRRLYHSKMIDAKENKDGSYTIILTKNGKDKALTFKLDEMKINQPSKWDGQWRIVLFDIPEKQRKIRDAFRYHLKQLGFYEFQKSVFVHPYDCEDEINYLIEFYNARRYIRFIVANSLDNELHLQTHFNLTN
ncbi:MAG: CRISPR-associated endonuclease Cas2 [Candidatus Tagabacteria bacterium CG_4_10_14_0_2_um_filter_40_13]|uniref:CRISPR-associated endonuclease Cas2 n=3 Tax=Candidatus Tagaibacteriota TaxID=1817918 RepID=A0A2M8G959_9BACT|nr:MAG: CRISPR-associated endonuclease Cas2 [Candidatus Tagabacteria bacterium CG11_big_fil_rev_8_21_14_0_20_41_11]PIU99506.1 MAG: CRISPR-associated endonuclease Cas2 [Candidatus Tagabacteria bacterium CG03_land_8_20_14_0_80_41_22]PIZ56435.1 MAG: CRISPR-associated endonuclease Cas2 [Candidatus Tagabacteria bacterium CG_4_10_14_0_2_um_filter_40_13]PJC25068.1 MAG: CRISPR-associated endonuclease Cas2 [Candidatus Tagabacteria bacterium CG_4_9_14_0_2_um_filter_41_11]PJC69997.1 MAG: CRISPR-associated